MVDSMTDESKPDKEPLINVLEVAGNAIVGGMEKYVYNMVKHLPPRGFKVTTLVPYESNFTASLRDMGSEVFIAAMDENPQWRSIQFTVELIHQKKIDLLHAHLPRAHVLAGISGRLANIPTVATVHGMDINSDDLGIHRTTGSWLTVVCQEAYVQALALGVPEERLTLIPNGVDTKVYNPRRSGERFRRSVGIPLDVPLVGFVGRFAPEKGPDQFIQAAEHIHKHRKDVHFVLVGEGPMEFELKKMIQDKGLAGATTMPGLLADTHEIYPALDVFVQTSRVEGMPFAILEAMSCGTPVVAIGVGGVPEIIVAGTTGLLSAQGDWAGVGNAVIKLLEDPVRKRQMGEAARKRVEDFFNLDESTRRMSELFHRLVGSYNPITSFLPPVWPVTRQESSILERGTEFQKPR
jgi:glycosyltransferase involved in cell wall biosynthesis